MEIHPFHEVTKGLRLKGSEAWIANLPAERKAACQSPMKTVFLVRGVCPAAGQLWARPNKMAKILGPTTGTPWQGGILSQGIYPGERLA